MREVKRSVEVINPIPYEQLLETVELAGRNCYQSYNKVAEGSAEKLIKQFIKVNHGSPLEFGYITVRIVGDRSLMGQITRHRLSSFCIESARYNNYMKDKYGKEISVIVPRDIDIGTQEYRVWRESCVQAEDAYCVLIGEGCKPETARSVLPMCLATTIVMGANVREWRHVLKLRTSPWAQSDIREVANMILDEFIKLYPAFFEDLKGEEYASHKRA